MRTTVRLPEDLLAEAKKIAAERGTTLTRVLEGALRESLSRARRVAGQREPVRLVTAGGGGTLPGVDLDDSAALLELMESGPRP